MGVLDCELKLEILAKKSAERTEPCHVQLVVTGYVAFPMADRWQGNIIYVALRSQEETGTGSSAKQTWDCPGSASGQFIIMTLFYIVCIMCKCLSVPNPQHSGRKICRSQFSLEVLGIEL